MAALNDDALPREPCLDLGGRGVLTKAHRHRRYRLRTLRFRDVGLAEHRRSRAATTALGIVEPEFLVRHEELPLVTPVVVQCLTALAVGRGLSPIVERATVERDLDGLARVGRDLPPALRDEGASDLIGQHHGDAAVAVLIAAYRASAFAGAGTLPTLCLLPYPRIPTSDPPSEY
jgi:hypothetical protein